MRTATTKHYIQIELMFQLATNRQALPAVHEQLIHLGHSLGQEELSIRLDKNATQALPLVIPKGRAGGDLRRWFSELFETEVTSRANGLQVKDAEHLYTTERFAPEPIIFDDWHDTVTTTVLFIQDITRQSAKLTRDEVERALIEYSARLARRIGCSTSWTIRFGEDLPKN